VTIDLLEIMRLGLVLFFVLMVWREREIGAAKSTTVPDITSRWKRAGTSPFWNWLSKEHSRNPPSNRSKKPEQSSFRIQPQ
jgi:hypothetical protein